MLENNPKKKQKYPTYLEIPERKKDTRKYPIVFFDTPTRPEPDSLPGILSNTRPDPMLKNPTRWALSLISKSSNISWTLWWDIQNCAFFTLSNKSEWRVKESMTPSHCWLWRLQSKMMIDRERDSPRIKALRSESAFGQRRLANQ